MIPVARVALAHSSAGAVRARADALLAAAEAAAAVAQAHADAVDRDARFPQEALESLREHGLIGAMVPAAQGGAGASLATVAAICRVLGAACASTGMIYAMHQIQVACVLEHGTASPWHQGLLARIAAEQLLLASATSEEAIGGALRSSGCALNVDGERFHLLKMAPTISYGAHADGILITSRRHADAGPSDQVLVCALKPDYTLQSLNTWDTLGMRGTCSNGFRLEASGAMAQVLPVPFGEIADATMTPVSHILWSALWLGICSDAVARAKTYFQGQARARPGALPPSAARVAEAVSLLQLIEGRLELALEQQRRRHAEPPVASAFALAAGMNGLKTAVSMLALEAVQQAMLVCGMAGYKHGTPFSLGRHLRDLWSAPLMINNDRILTNTANLLLADRS
ncbi:acyl-CoA dehydrogenase family protein [Cupriavidus taiwanensis]|uniref:acyl-CoA dehydrogenase family protein n=1 Tax=Cupriavidus taiwanensis TaxID=164546 RepID=UPI000E1072B8|nr:acyl-CoA dehydrogenase family protein [Cupriavidus taiwanensis]SPA29969.1 Acyl-CoA dehydrogenase [Cupriavidus taiwanensis]SPA55141.1 Acyl-CoA dehydrogenase [Cupriavidus taiwanensis]